MSFSLSKQHWKLILSPWKKNGMRALSLSGSILFFITQDTDVPEMIRVGFNFKTDIPGKEERVLEKQ